MYVSKAEIKNFRLLQDVTLSLEERTTVIVGRNNSGKTSLTELFRRLSAEVPPSFRLEDFSLSVHESFWKAFLLTRGGGEEEDIRKALPGIEVRLTIRYDLNAIPGSLARFIVDLDSECDTALVVITYELRPGQIDALLDNACDEELDEQEQRIQFFRTMRDRVPKYYAATVTAMDPNDPTNQRALAASDLHALLRTGFIFAQRGLDDVTHEDRDVLGKILEAIFRTATSESADPDDRDIAKKLEEAVKKVEEGIDKDVNANLKKLLPAFQRLGYPGLSDPDLCTETTLDVQRLLKNHTRVQYIGTNEVNLPEAYNGLGVRNLIFILLHLWDFYKSFKAMEPTPGLHLVFIEEPEVHLHPQMQEVFISQLSGIGEVFAEDLGQGTPWPVQFVVSTHSAHVANKAAFDSMRYFLASSDEEACSSRSTQVKDLREGLGGTPQEDRDFLHKYMTLTRCDLLFADKAVLIEGTSERLLLPKMVDKVDAEQPNGRQLSSQYVSVVEVGGACAHLFFGLLDFLELRTLIITDLDAVNENDGGKCCRVADGTSTSNECIKSWFGGPARPVDLAQKPDEEKIRGLRRLVYQVPETAGGPCGRSFEDAFMLANPALFYLADVPQQRMESEAYEKAESVRSKKSDFALEYAIRKPDWSVPRYIAEGLRWLAEGTHCLAIRAPVVEMVEAEAVPEPVPLQAEECHE